MSINKTVKFGCAQARSLAAAEDKSTIRNTIKTNLDKLSLSVYLTTLVSEDGKYHNSVKLMVGN